MNLTLSLLAGLLLLLPGIAAVSAWNHGGHSAARRPELALTSISALFVLLTASILAHVTGYLVIGLARPALIELGQLIGWSAGPIADDPYLSAFKFMLGDKPGDTELTEALTNLAAFVGAIALETLMAFSLLRHPGLDIFLEPFDLRGQGWVYQNVVRPLRHGYRPIAYVLTDSVHEGRGLGYEGVVADIRQGTDGEIKALCLAEPSRFVYELRDSKPPKFLIGGGRDPEVEIFESEWIGGVLAIEPARIRNIVIHNIREEVVDDVVDLSIETKEDAHDA